VVSFTFSLFCFAGSTEPVTASDPAVLVIDGTRITIGELDRENPSTLFHARNVYYEAEKKAIASFVDGYLLANEAKKENVTVDELLEKHAYSNLPKDPSDESLRIYYEGLDTTQPFEAVRGQIIDHIRQSRRQKALAVYMQSLKSQAKVEMLLEAPRAQISFKDTPVRGIANAPVTIVEYADFECPYCQKAQLVMEKVLAEYKDKVDIAYKDVPLPMHSHAQKAAEAAHCAGAQGKYWEYHDLLYKDKQLEVDDLKAEARKLNLDGAAFDKCLDSGQQAQVVKDSLAEGTGFQLEGTPAFFINGRFLNGIQTFSQWQKVIDEELATAATRRAADNASVASR
jgi:protein-disulfide isomerase